MSCILDTDIAEDLDDTQLYVHCSPTAVSQLELCLVRVDKWMAASRRKLNSEKSEVIWVGFKRTVMQDARPALQIGTGSISASHSVRLLGVLISADLSFHLTGTSRRLLGSVTSTAFCA